MKKEIVILSGFLGSGKTTVLQNLIKASSNKRVAILLNDFGDTPVDGALIDSEKGDAPVVEIGGGSVFCSCLKEAFVKALFSLSTGNAERVIVEASGMSDPTGVTRMLELARLDTFYQEALIICLFDPQRSLKLAKVLEVIPRQVKAAHVVVLTKSDITTEDERQAACEYIRSVHPEVPIIESYNGFLDLQSLPTSTPSPVNMSLLSFNTPETRLDSFTITKKVKNVEEFLSALGKYEFLLRVKGCIETDNGVIYVTDSPEGIVTRELDMPTVPLTVICMQNKGEVLQKQLEELL